MSKLVSFIAEQERVIMIGYVTVGTNDLTRAAAFYDALLGELGAKRFMESDAFVAWAVRPDLPGFGVTKPFDKQAATVGNGVMVALVVDSEAKVNSLHRKALQLGGKDEGAPGKRSENFYAGYFRDLDGNKLNIFVGG
jgi:catechol 2,3-dioxygenase-like lactoylglutathione lyase family enzyme